MCNLKNNNLFGKVNSVKQYTYDATTIAGKVVKRKRANDITFHHEVHSFYNETGDMLHESIYNTNGQLLQKSVYSFYDIGKPLEELVYVQDEIIHKTEFIYNDNGKEIGRRSYFQGNDLYEELVNEFDYNGIITEVRVLNQEGDLVFTRTYKDDKKGNLVEFTECKADGTLVEKHISMYDGNNCEVERIAMITRFFNKIITKYDVYHNTIEEIVYRDKDVVDLYRNFEYLFDSQKNWVQKIVIVQGVPKKIVERTIEYF